MPISAPAAPGSNFLAKRNGSCLRCASRGEEGEHGVAPVVEERAGEQPARRRDERRGVAAGRLGRDDAAGEHAGEARAGLPGRVGVDVDVVEVFRGGAEVGLPQRGEREARCGQEHEGQLLGPRGIRADPGRHPEERLVLRIVVTERRRRCGGGGGGRGGGAVVDGEDNDQGQAEKQGTEERERVRGQHPSRPSRSAQLSSPQGKTRRRGQKDKRAKGKASDARFPRPHADEERTAARLVFSFRGPFSASGCGDGALSEPCFHGGAHAAAMPSSSKRVVVPPEDRGAVTFKVRPCGENPNLRSSVLSGGSGAKDRTRDSRLYKTDHSRKKGSRAKATVHEV
ncbi:hypothetical protein EUGRSUZ_C02769 [Eucalyptus grandis]|uniref:Uncharacterized protein n=2 Tax=Eucalyptus grandis TaxID=71139 RepID=A0ACC3LGM2_EUCGR|nr:hypothetical protein EUGRSUZ_C02769 [Eucalyptus grandis]